MDRLIIFI